MAIPRLPLYSFTSVLFLTAEPSTVALAQTQLTVADGVYSQAQASRGEALYFDNCLVCHGNVLQGEEDSPSLTGKPFMDHWGGLPVSALFNYINTQMPQGQPGILGAVGNADIVAFLLSKNNFPAGQTDLPADKSLGTIIINK